MKHSIQKNISPIVLFILVTLALSSLFYFFIIYSGTLGGGRGQYVMGLMWSPGIAALMTMKILNRDMADCGWQWGKTKYQIRSYAIPIFYALSVYVIIWLLGWGEFYNKEFVNRLTQSFGLGELSDGFSIGLYVVLAGIFGTLRGTASALGEELGWRGFLVPELYKTQGFTKTSLISGTIWGAWHLPILLFADYNSGTPAWYAMSCFMVTIIGISFIYTWFRIKSGSLWTAVILHATHNLFIQNIFTPLTVNTGDTAYYIDEFGIVLPVVAMGLAFYFWFKRDELKTSAQHKA